MLISLFYVWQTKVFKKDQVGQVNPPKFDCSDDMAGLTYLNDACVLWNSVVRYKNELIYTYSGLFCIAINPYKRFPIYTQRTMDIYIGMRRFVQLLKNTIGLKGSIFNNIFLFF